MLIIAACVGATALLCVMLFRGTNRNPRGPSNTAADVTVTSSAPQTLKLLEFPKDTTSMILIIGSNLDTMTPPADGIVLAFEPVLATAAKAQVEELDGKQRNKPRTYVIPAAVSNHTGFTTFWRDQTRSGDSSSLSKLSKAGQKLYDWLSFVPSYVPVLSFSDVLDSIPRSVDIQFLKTDMQGFDFVAVSSGGARIRRATKVQTEVYLKGYRTYAANSNSLELQWKPFMKRWGFNLTSVKQVGGEADATWQRLENWKAPV